MKRRVTSVCASTIALGIIGTVAAAPVTPSKTAVPAKPASAKKDAKSAAAMKTKGPTLSKWQLHVLQMLHISAPGDEYFGRMKMSYLGINNTFHDQSIRAGDYTTDPKILSAVNFADESLNAWARKYPNDPQLARSYFLAFQMYRKVWVAQYQDKAWKYAHIVLEKWPQSYFGKALKKDLAIGFTEHYFATPVPCPQTPSPEPSPSNGRNGRNGVTPSPSPSPTETPEPTPSPAPGQPRIDILPVPCSTPTPTPTPTPLPILSPLPTGSLAPSPLPSSAPQPTSSGVPSATPSASGSPAPTPSTPATPSFSATPSAHPHGHAKPEIKTRR